MPGGKSSPPGPVRTPPLKSDGAVNALIKAMTANKPQRPLSKPKVTGGVKLSKCAAKYAVAIADPFSPLATQVCIPSGSAIPSQKVTGFLRFDGVIGSSGFGYITASPSGCSDVVQLFYTETGYTGTNVSMLSGNNTVAPGVNVATVSNLPYTFSQHVLASNNDIPTVRSRVVAAGLTVQYTGTAQSESGMIYCLRDPAHGNAAMRSGSSIGQNVTSISSRDVTSVSAFSRDRCTLSDFAATKSEMDYPVIPGNFNQTQTDNILVYPFTANNILLPSGSGVNSFSLALTDSSTGFQYQVCAPTMCIVITGTAGQTFHGEYVVHVEYAGTACSSSSTPTDSDEQGAGFVVEAANGIARKKTARPTASNWELIYDGLAQAIKRAAPVIVPLAEKALMALLV